ncbi:MAG TPA: arginine deiminase family protein [Polyangium sp.]|nr:arginine deiminase family protein [Polyangium sp.]
MTIALTRAVSPALAHCELTHIDRVPIDVERARLQHHAYEEALRRLGVTVVALEAESDLPDSVFVEDTAVVLDEIAVMTRPGAISRRAEVASVARALEPYRKLAWIPEPATIDGGDVLRIGKTIYVGLSTRSNAASIRALAAIVEPHGYRVQGVELSGCLHLKSAVTTIARDRLLVNPKWVNPGDFGALVSVHVHPDEPFAANALRIGEAVIYPTNFPRTLERIAQFVRTIEGVDVSELAKAEGAVTCCSLVIE